jgi:hypothetical protein
MQQGEDKGQMGREQLWNFSSWKDVPFLVHFRHGIPCPDFTSSVLQNGQ